MYAVLFYLRIFGLFICRHKFSFTVLTVHNGGTFLESGEREKKIFSRLERSFKNIVKYLWSSISLGSFLAPLRNSFFVIKK
jgi:hypothetical protein